MNFQKYETPFSRYEDRKWNDTLVIFKDVPAIKESIKNSVSTQKTTFF